MKTLNKVKTLVLGATVAALGACGVVAPVFAADSAYDTAHQYINESEATGSDTDLMSTLNTIINVIIGVIGFVAVVVIILGGVQYTTSAGAADKVKTAKDTIMYGIIGLVIALLAFAIVNFILSSIFGN